MLISIYLTLRGRYVVFSRSSPLIIRLRPFPVPSYLYLVVLLSSLSVFFIIFFLLREELQ